MRATLQRLRRAAALALGLALAQTAHAGAANLGHLAPTGDPRHEVLVRFAERVAEGTGGAVAIQVFPNSTLGSEREMFEQVQAGITQFALVGSIVANFYRAWSIIDMPFMWQDGAHLRAFVDSPLAESWKADMAESLGVEMLAFFERNPRILTSATRPVRMVDDLRGMKVRVPNIDVYMDTWRALGVEPVPMPAADFYMGLRLGTIDAMENPVEVMYHWKIFEVSKYLTPTEHMRSGFFLIASTRYMDRLSPEHQAVVREAAARAQAEMAEANAEGAATLFEALEAAGMTIVRDVDVEGFRVRSEPVHAAYMHHFGREAYDVARELAGR